MPKVSICIPTYKHPQHLARTLQSILSQSFQDYEIIITDDSDNPEVQAILNSFNWQITPIYVQNQPILGVPNNWNFCLSLAKGEYIKFMFYDDYFLHQYSLAHFVEALDNHPDCNIAFSSALVADLSVNLYYVNQITSEQIDLMRKIPQVLILKNYIGMPSQTIFRKNTQLTFDPQLKWMVDLDFYLNILKRNSNFINLAEPLVGLVIDKHNLSHHCRDNAQIEVFENFYLYEKHISALSSPSLFQKNLINLLIKYKIYNPKTVKQMGYLGTILPIIKPVFWLNRCSKYLAKLYRNYI
jgi:glycosyltransferase involved in cell wall biosynthesis